MMNKRTWLGLALALSVLLTVGMVWYVRWVVDFVLHWSGDLGMNGLHMLGMTVPLAAVSFLEGLLLREAWHFIKGQQEEEDPQLPGEVAPSKRQRIKSEVRRQIRETWILWGVFIGVPLLLNVLLINAATGGYVLSGQGGLTRYAAVATMLRSDDPAERRDGLDAAVGLTERSLGIHVARIIARRGENAPLAAWVAGTRGDQEAVVPLRWMFLEGDEVERRAAILALARLGDRRGAQLAHQALRRGEEPRLELILTMGLTAHEPAEPMLQRMAGDSDVPEILRAACMWAIGQIEQERFSKSYYEQASSGVPESEMVQPERRGYEPMLEALQSDSQVLRCAAVQSLGYSGPVEAAEPLMSIFEQSGYTQKCQSLAVEQHEVTHIEFVRFGLIRSQIIDALAKIGNRSIVTWLQKQGDDRKNADEVILKARDLARQIREI